MRLIHPHQIVYSFKRNFNSAVKFVSDSPRRSDSYKCCNSSYNHLCENNCDYWYTDVFVTHLESSIMFQYLLQVIAWSLAVKCSISSFLLDISQKPTIEINLKQTFLHYLIFDITKQFSLHKGDYL